MECLVPNSSCNQKIPNETHYTIYMIENIFLMHCDVLYFSSVVLWCYELAS